mmetsp:Transcript_26265/g.26514  ORF Transcript_26265/g.26514 Transcript_26265/m.26514 type:complete len:89 (-) Transcript_26265:504-770(-)
MLAASTSAAMIRLFGPEPGNRAEIGIEASEASLRAKGEANTRPPLGAVTGEGEGVGAATGAGVDGVGGGGGEEGEGEDGAGAGVSATW